MPGQNTWENGLWRKCKTLLVCRAGWMMGAGPAKDKKFIQKLMKQLKDGKKELFHRR
jgi:dTDP-4-dehydrorhamnose reductase